MDGVGESARLLTEYDEVLAGWADPDADYEKLGERAGRPREARSRPPAPGTSKRTVEVAMDALRLPAGRRRRHHAVRRRAAPGRAVPPAAVPARPAAARRAHQPPRRRVGGVAGAVPAGLRGHRRGHHPRPLLPRQRGRLDPRARPRPGHPLRGQLLVVARAEAGPPGPRGEARHAPASAPSSASSSGCAWPRRPARPRARPGSPPTRSCWPRRRRPRAAPPSSRSSSPRATGSATR